MLEHPLFSMVGPLLFENWTSQQTDPFWLFEYLRCYFSSWALHEPLVRMRKKVLFHDFLMFFIVFNHANACASMHLLVEIHKSIFIHCSLKHLNTNLTWCKWLSCLSASWIPSIWLSSAWKRSCSAEGTNWRKKIRKIRMMMWDHSVWSRHIHKTSLQMRACSLFTPTTILYNHHK